MVKSWVFIFLCIVITNSAFAQQKNFSLKEYEKCDHQKVFNAAKKLFSADKENEYIIDTSWDKLKVVKRESKISLFYADVAQTVYIFDVNATKQKTKIQLQIYTQTADKTPNYLSSEDVEHELFWNRLGYILGKNDWIECSTLSTQSFLCKIDKESIKP